MVHRVFAWGPGYRYVTHRPPTVVNEKGQDLKQVGWLSKRATARMNIRMYHYDMILPKQAACKSAYYSNVDWHMLENGKVADWKHRVFDCLERPFHIYTVYTHLSWLNRYRGAHPPPVEWMLRDIQAGLWPGMELRRTDDIERMLRSARFRLLRSLASVSTTIEAYLYYGRSILRRFLMRTPAWVTVQRLRGRNPA